MKDILVSLIFFKRSLVFPILLFSSYFFALIPEEGFLISPCYSFSSIQSLSHVWLFETPWTAILWNSAFKWVYLSFSPLPFAYLLFTAICKVFSDNILPFCISFSWGWSWSLPSVQCHELLSRVLWAPCLSDLIAWIYFSLHCMIIRDLI